MTDYTHPRESGRRAEETYRLNKEEAINMLTDAVFSTPPEVFQLHLPQSSVKSNARKTNRPRLSQPQLYRAAAGVIEYVLLMKILYCFTEIERVAHSRKDSQNLRPK
jgi:hypothetical protein